MYNSELRDALLNTRVVSRYLRRSVERDMRGFSLVYQPQADRDGRVIAAEALLRWDPNCGHVVGPDVFVPLLERSRRIIPVGRWVLAEAVRQLVEFRAQGIALQHIGVNVSARQLHPEFTRFVVDTVETAGLDSSDIVLELTEGQALADSARISSCLTDLQTQGFAWHIDDFGTGYASMRWLRSLAFRGIKLDRSLLIATTEPPGMIHALCVMAHALGMHVTCEGVETPEQLQRVLDAGVDTVQGWHVGMPVAPGEFTRVG
jgi:EAL domain-containing protein (putative c-di-GMP-specific phosphodiesterase class I)